MTIAHLAASDSCRITCDYTVLTRQTRVHHNTQLGFSDHGSAVEEFVAFRFSYDTPSPARLTDVLPRVFPRVFIVFRRQRCAVTVLPFATKRLNEKCKAEIKTSSS